MFINKPSTSTYAHAKKILNKTIKIDVYYASLCEPH